MSIHLQGILFAIISAICYGMNPLGALFLYEEGLNVTSVIFYRFLFATLILFLLVLMKRSSFKIQLREFFILIFLGFLFSISALSLFKSFLHIDAGLASTILFTYPIFVALIMCLFFKEKSSFIIILAIVLANLGVIFLFSNTEAKINNIGFFLVLVSSISYAIYIVVINQYLKMSALKVTFYSMFFCTLFIFVYSFLAEDLSIMPLSNFKMWFYTIFLAFVPTIISLLFLIKAIQIIGSTLASILGALEPLTAVIIGVLIFDELITLSISFGILLILLGVILIILKKKLEKIFSKI